MAEDRPSAAAPRSWPPKVKSRSPWRKGPNCDTKRAQASYARYRKKEPKA